MTEIRDVFICHASEDKKEIVTPIVQALNNHQISYWYDEAEIKWGDSITGKVNKGLSISRYIIVILSASFISKNWPQRELNAVLNIEASSGEVKVLPLLVGTDEEQRVILEKYPLLNDKRFLPWNNNVKEIVVSLQDRLKKSPVEEQSKASLDNDLKDQFDIKMPQIKKKYTQRDKDRYLMGSFEVISSYFRAALSKLESHHSEIEVDFIEVNNIKFICTVYVNGEIGNKCKIWVGGSYSSNSICYSEGSFDIENDNSYNDWLHIENDEIDLGFRLSNMWFGKHEYTDKDIINTEDAAKYLWERFISTLN